MNMDERIARINALYHKSQAEGLTEEEKAEQAQLRKEYVASWTASPSSAPMAPPRTWARSLERSPAKPCCFFQRIDLEHSNFNVWWCGWPYGLECGA